MGEGLELHKSLINLRFLNYYKKITLTIHQQNLLVLVTEIYKVKNDRSCEIMKTLFEFIEPFHSLQSGKSVCMCKC